jgi:cytochrome c556
MARKYKPPTLAARCEETGMTQEEAWEDLWEDMEIAHAAATKLQARLARVEVAAKALLNEVAFDEDQVAYPLSEEKLKNLFLAVYEAKP